MLLNFYGNLMEVQIGIDILKSEFKFKVHPQGIPVLVEKREGNIEAAFSEGKGTIRYHKKIHFYRALGLFLEALKQGTGFCIIEEPQFEKNGVMLDASRNAVMRVESLKRLIRKLAVMGLNLLMLYTEDTFAIADRPYFGYMRGRYTHEELKDCDEYAGIFGIEMIPCIQTLSHLGTALRWPCTEPVRDTGCTLLAGEKGTYDFIEDMIRSASAPFRSKRIHIGMDEANDLGLGSYLEKNGFHRRFDIMTSHLEKVLEITRKYGLEPMMWSDMFFRLASEKHIYHDPDAIIPEDVINSVPKEVGLVYWDYNGTDTDFYASMIERHRNFRSKTVFAGGIHIWSGCGTNYGKTLATARAALEACKKEKVREVFATAWMDNGAENNAFSTLLGLQLYAELGYSGDFDLNKLERRFKFCTGCDLNAFMDLGLLDGVPGTAELNMPECNPSKYLLWQDVLMGIFDSNSGGSDVGDHYTKLAQRYERYEKTNGEFGFVFRVPRKLAGVLGIKAGIGLKLKELYDKNDRKGLGIIALEVLPRLSALVKALMREHRTQWFAIYKAFGWEVLDIRYHGLAGRIDTAANRIKDYLEGRISSIEELEEERLPFFESTAEECGEEAAGMKHVRFNSYVHTATANPL